MIAGWQVSLHRQDQVTPALVMARQEESPRSS